MQTVVFDLDGTLADTSHDLLNAGNVCFEHMGYENVLKPDQDSATALRGARALLTLGLKRLDKFDEAVVNNYYPIFVKAYAQNLCTHTHFFPGALRAVQILKDRGIISVICTNKPYALAQELMVRLGARHLFSGLIGADSLPTRKPDPASYRAIVAQSGGRVSQSLMIGDTQTDHKTARALGVPSVLVDFGIGDEDIHALNPDAILKNYNDLPLLVETLLQKNK